MEKAGARPLQEAVSHALSSSSGATTRLSGARTREPADPPGRTHLDEVLAPGGLCLELGAPRAAEGCPSSRCFSTGASPVERYGAVELNVLQPVTGEQHGFELANDLTVRV